MLKEYLLERDADQAEWTTAIPGVHVCRFELPGTAELRPLPLPENAAPLQFETLFCQNGALLAELPENRLLTAEEREIFLLSDASRLRSAQISGDLRGLLVAVDAAAARDSLRAVCAGLGLVLDTGAVRHQMEAQEGCAASTPTTALSSASTAVSSSWGLREF